MRESVKLSTYFAFGLALILPFAARAQSWTTDPQLWTEARWWDNPRLRTGSTEDVNGGILDFDVLFARQSERGEISFRPRVRRSQYSGASDLDSTDRFIDFAVERRGERSGWTLNSQVAQDTTLATEIETTGIFDTSRRQELASVASTFYGLVRPRLEVGGGVAGTSVRYQDTDSVDLTDYDYANAKVFVNLIPSERNRVTMSIRVAELDASEVGISQTEYWINAGLERDAGELWRLNINGGPARIESADGPSDNAVLFEAGATRTGERFDARFSVDRSLTPVGRGILTERERLIVSVTRRISQRTAIVLSLQRIDTRDLVPEASVVLESRNYNRAEVRLEQSIGRRWRFAARAVWADQKYELASAKANQQQLVVGFGWQGGRSGAR